MPLQFVVKDIGRIDAIRVDFDNVEKLFVVHSAAAGQNQVKVSYGFDGFSDPLNDLIVELFWHPGHVESQVLPIQVNDVGDQTVGWIATVEAITSRNHTHFSSSYFRRAIHAATNWLLNRGIQTKTPEISAEADLTISDFFDPELSVLVLSKPLLNGLVGERCIELGPALLKLGFIPYTGFHTKQLNLGAIANQQLQLAGNRLRLQCTSKDVKAYAFVDQVFRNLMPYASTSVLKFYFYYQIIEALLASVFSHKQSGVISRMVTVKDDPIQVRPLMDQLREFNEKKRIVSLFHEFTNVESSCIDLKAACEAFILAHGSATIATSTRPNAAEALYDVRNILFHDLQHAAVGALPFVDPVVDQLAVVIPEMLINFKNPA